MKNKTFASLFTGGGIADIGALNAGFDLLWGIEYDYEIAKVGRQLPHKDKLYCNSVIGFNFSKLEKPNHLHLSPPCQDFSIAKNKTAYTSYDNDELADACIEAIEVLNPDSVTLENVPQYKNSEQFKKIVDCLYFLGYRLQYGVYNAKFFGVPQSRERLILRARKEKLIPRLKPDLSPIKSWYEAIEHSIDDLPDSQFPPCQIPRIPPDYYSENKQTFLLTPNSTGLKRAQPYDVIRKDKPYPTIKASKSYNNAFIAEHNKKQRIVEINTKCLAILQTIPDWYKLPIQKTLARKIIGNGVPSLFMQKVLESLY